MNIASLMAVTDIRPLVRLISLPLFVDMIGLNVGIEVAMMTRYASRVHHVARWAMA